MRCACIDIGTNTTRVVVADWASGRLAQVAEARAFTRIGRAVEGGRIPPEKADEVARVVGRQRALAEEAGASVLRVVATAAIRGAANGAEFAATVERFAAVRVNILAGAEEARLAFVGATRTLGRRLEGDVAVVDVGGGSTEIAVGTLDAGVRWWASRPVGSGVLAERCVRHDPPTSAELDAMREEARASLGGLDVPPVGWAVAVGGSAQSMGRVVGEMLEPGSLRHALAALRAGPAAEVGRRLGVDPERVKLLPAGILVLDAAAQRLRCPLQIGRGGLREGVLLELAGA